MGSTSRFAFALALCVAALSGCHKHCSGLSRCPAGDDYDGDACGCKPVAAASAAPDAFACGEGATCDGLNQICAHVVGEAAPGCITLPTACVRDVSCGCLVDALRERGASQCSGEGRHLSLRIDAP
jgi:hypothetical protein